MVYPLLIVTKYNLWNNNNTYIHYLHEMYLYLKLCKIDNYVIDKDSFLAFKY